MERSRPGLIISGDRSKGQNKTYFQNKENLVPRIYPAGFYNIKIPYIRELRIGSVLLLRYYAKETTEQRSLKLPERLDYNNCSTIKPSEYFHCFSTNYAISLRPGGTVSNSEYCEILIVSMLTVIK